MKLLVAVVQDIDANRLRDSLSAADFKSTKLSSTGGFLREGSTTFLIGVEDDEVAQVKQIIGETCRERTKFLPAGHFVGHIEGAFLEPMEVAVGGAVVFVLPLDELFRLGDGPAAGD